jgi:outer membrane protein OmpA-like peptidoglycan-associated protein
MKRITSLLLLLFAGIAISSAQTDEPGCKDPSLFTRMPNFHIYRCEDLQFDKFEFRTSSEKSQTIEGHSIYVNYYLNENAQTPSGLQIVRNYTNAVKKIGGQVIYEYDDGGTEIAIMKVAKNGLETWAMVAGAGNGMYTINVIEKETMKQDVVADASSMAGSIRETGKVALYGIYFDTGKAVLKSESKPSLAEISKLLKADPELKLYVVGHTDNVGKFESNMRLSMERAMAVVNALITQYGISATRLTGFGDGPTAPVASNDKEEGRALNRRVELVKQ